MVEGKTEPPVGLRKRIGLTLLLGGLGLVLISFLLEPRVEGGLNVAKIVFVSLGTVAVLMGLSVLVLGTLKVVSLVRIDLRGERPVFFIGFPLCSVRLSDRWAPGALALSRLGLYLVVPATVRWILILLASYLAFSLLAPHLPLWAALLLTVALAVVLWRLQKLLRGSPDPAAARADGNDEPAAPDPGRGS